MSRSGGARATVQAVLLALLAWAALVCSGLGGSFGAVSQTLAGKLAAGAQHLQRQGGASAASRALRRDVAAVAVERKVADDVGAWVERPAGDTVSAGGLVPPVGRPRADVPVPAATEPRLGTCHRLPPSRAPPALA